MEIVNIKALRIGLFFILTAVILGAFGAHALKEILSPEKLLSFETGVRYQFYHGLAITILSILPREIFNKTNFYLLLWGTILFSVSIYLLALNSYWKIAYLKFLGPITPIGGTILILGWTLILLKTFKK
jgi:uncharacterized membrane protein YgdD (TMEM256/DUF423 family)